MASFSLTDATTWVHGYDFTTDMNEISLSLSAEELDVTTFGSGGYRTRIAGLKDVESNLKGFWQSAESAAVDPQAFPDLGTADRVITQSPTGVAASTAYMYQAGKFTYELFGSIGEATPFSLGCKGTNGVGVVRGQVAAAKGNVSATGQLGSILSLGAVGATQYLYGTLHVFSAGTTITVQLQSDDDVGFASPTTRATFSLITTTGGNWAVRTAGALAETHYRLNVSAITGTFQVAGAIGIG